MPRTKTIEGAPRMGFNKAMAALSRGHSVRRVSWKRGMWLVRRGVGVSVHNAPKDWVDGEWVLSTKDYKAKDWIAPTMDDRLCPQRIDLIEAYMKQHFLKRPAVVFCDVDLGHGDARRDHVADLTGANTADIVSAALYVEPRPARGLSKFVNGLDHVKYGFVLAWGGTKFLTQNT